MRCEYGWTEGGERCHGCAQANQCVIRLAAERDALRDALKEIYEGRGPFSQDILKHAENVIEAARLTAARALGITWEPLDGNTL